MHFLQIVFKQKTLVNYCNNFKSGHDKVTFIEMSPQNKLHWELKAPDSTKSKRKIECDSLNDSAWHHFHDSRRYNEPVVEIETKIGITFRPNSISATINAINRQLSKFLAGGFNFHTEQTN